MMLRSARPQGEPVSGIANAAPQAATMLAAAAGHDLAGAYTALLPAAAMTK